MNKQSYGAKSLLMSVFLCVAPFLLFSQGNSKHPLAEWRNHQFFPTPFHTLEWNSLPGVEALQIRQLQMMQEITRYRMKNGFSPYRVSAAWDEPGKLMLHAFDLKFRTPSYAPIRYNPVYLKAVLPQSQAQRFSVLKLHPETQFRFANVDLCQMSDSLAIYKPMLAKYRWAEIPSPHRYILDGILMDTKAADEAFRTRMEDNKIDTKKYLQKAPPPKSNWSYTGVESIQFSQNYLTNWAKGGENAVALLSDLRASANYKKGTIQWDNRAIHKLGVIANGSEDPRLNDDLIHMSSKLGVNASQKWFYSGLFDFKTQFFYGRDRTEERNIVSGFMAPAYLTFAIGMDYKRDNNFTMLLSPITSKITMVLDTAHVSASRYKIEPGRVTSIISGASLTNSLKWKISHDYYLASEFDFFYGYLSDNPEIQFDWEIIFDMRINKYLSARINPRVRFFENESKKLQFKENFSIAFLYRF
jgi:hypothetical protein